MEFLSDFGIQPILLAAQIVNFLVLLWILKRLLYKPILKILEERKQRIAQSLKNAEEIERRLTELGEREDEAMLKSAREGEKLIKQATEASAAIIEDGKRRYEEILRKAVEDAKELTKLEKIKLEQEVKDHLSEIVTLALKSVTGKLITTKDQKKMVEEAVSEIQ